MPKTPEQQQRFDDLKQRLSNSLREQIKKDNEDKAKAAQEEAKFYDKIFYDAMEQLAKDEADGYL